MNPYEQLIQDLIDGKIEKIDVKREELMAFREAWLKLENRKCESFTYLNRFLNLFLTLSIFTSFKRFWAFSL